MKNNKKFIAIFMCCTVAFCVLGIAFWGIVAAIRGNKRPDIVCTTFVTYDWVREILGDKAEDYNIKYLMDSGVDLHNFQPTAEDIMSIKRCKLLVYIGGESDEWLVDVLDDADIESIALLNVVEEDGKAEEEAEPESAAPEEEEEEEGAFDEHIWLSLKNAQICVSALSEKLVDVYPDDAGDWSANATAYNAKLNTLDGQYAEEVGKAAKSQVLFADRFPFLYMCLDYGLEFDAAFSGCSAETEASVVKFTELRTRAADWGLHTILVTETANLEIAQGIISESDVVEQYKVMHSAQSVTENQLETTTYLGIMTGNLEVLKIALSASLS